MRIDEKKLRDKLLTRLALPNRTSGYAQITDSTRAADLITLLEVSNEKAKWERGYVYREMDVKSVIEEIAANLAYYESQAST